MGLLILFLTASALPATTYYVTVTGLGGEPDYEQHFAMWAKDIEKALKTSPDSKVETLVNATREQVRGALDGIAKEAKPQDALVVMLIGHGSFDGYEYKINLPGPDLTASELASLLDRIPASRQLVVNMTSSSGGADRISAQAQSRGDRRHQDRHRKERHHFRALLGGSVERSGRRQRQERSRLGARSLPLSRTRRRSAFYESQNRLATEHAVLEDTGKGEGVRAPSPENGEGMLAAQFPLLRIGAAAAAAKDPAKLQLLAKKEQLEQQIDKLKYEKAAIPPDEYKKQLGALLLELAQTQEEIDK